nr:transcription factor PAR2-like [Ipomoea batatas]
MGSPSSTPPSGGLPMRKSGRRSGSRRRTCELHHHQKSQRPLSGTGDSVSDKLEALKQLIPSHDEEIKGDQLFQETADYIVLLRTQVLVLQKLIDFYGSSNNSGTQNPLSADKELGQTEMKKSHDNQTENDSTALSCYGVTCYVTTGKDR